MDLSGGTFDEGHHGGTRAGCYLEERWSRRMEVVSAEGSLAEGSLAEGSLAEGCLAEGSLAEGWERSAGLQAPPAPSEGLLGAKGGGYLLAIGPPSRRLYPRATAAGRWLSALALPVVAVLPFLLVPAPYGPLGVAALGALACWLPTRLLAGLARRRLRRRLDAAPAGGPQASRLPQASSNTSAAPETARTERPAGSRQPSGLPAARRLVRLAGTVADQATVPSLFTRRPVVLATSEYAGVIETRGFDFDVRLADGTLVRVPARDAVLLGRGPRVHGRPQCGPLALTLTGDGPRLRSALLAVGGGWAGRLLDLTARELTLGPGDAVELCGELDYEPDESRSGGSRGPAMRAVLRPSDGLPAIVCKPKPEDRLPWWAK
jgi:hypothetical protein